MAPHSELEQTTPGTLPADFGDWDGGVPPATLPPDFGGFDDGAAEQLAVEAASAQSPVPDLSEEGAIEGAQGDADSLAKVESSDVAEVNAEEVVDTILSVPENGGGAGRMTMIALGLILLLAVGVVLYYSLRPSARKARAFPSHPASEVLASTSSAVMQVKVAEADSSDAQVLKAASGMQADAVVTIAPAEPKLEALKNSPSHSQSEPPAPTAKRHGKS